MKYIYYFCISLLLLLFACNKDEESLSSQEPYFKAIVNGKYWEADEGHVFTFVGWDDSTQEASYSITANKIGGGEAIQFDFPKVNSPGIFPIYETTNRCPNAMYDIYSCINREVKTQTYITPNIFNWKSSESKKIGEIAIEQIDGKYFKGSFHFKAYCKTPIDTVEVTGGEFLWKWSIL